jgi:hypothetical protein
VLNVECTSGGLESISHSYFEVMWIDNDGHYTRAHEFISKLRSPSLSSENRFSPDKYLDELMDILNLISNK